MYFVLSIIAFTAIAAFSVATDDITFPSVVRGAAAVTNEIDITPLKNLQGSTPAITLDTLNGDKKLRVQGCTGTVIGTTFEGYDNPAVASKYWFNVDGWRPFITLNDPTYGHCTSPDWSVGDEKLIGAIHEPPIYDANGCRGTLNSIDFDYFAYSPYPFCYGDISVWVGDSTPSGWKNIWSIGGGFTQGPTGWKHATITFPDNNYEVVFTASSSGIMNCKSFAPFYLDNIKVTLRF